MTTTAPSRTRASTLFHALSDETRLGILARLRHGERCVCELTGALDAAQSRLSFHLRILKEAGLVRGRKDGRWMYYALRPEALADAQAFLGSLAATPALPLLDEACCG